MNAKTKQYLVLGLLVAAGVAVVTGAAAGLSDWIGGLFDSATGKKGSSTSKVPKSSPDDIALVVGKLIDPANGGSATVKLAGNTYPVVVEVRSLGGPAHGVVRLRVTETPWIDSPQSFDFSWPDASIPAGDQAVQLTGDMPSMSLADAPISALIGRKAVAILYLDDTVIGGAYFTVSTGT